MILASREEFFTKMEELCALESASVIKGVRNLLMLVPTDTRVAQAMEAFGPAQSGGGASSGESQEKQLSPKAVLEQLFSTSGTSPTQLLYNLEVSHCYRARARG